MGGMGGMGGMGAYGAPKPAGGVVQTFAGAGGMQHQVMDCAKAFVGKVIGRGGETIMMIQQRSGAKVQIDQQMPDGQPCKINMSGMPQNLALATQVCWGDKARGVGRVVCRVWCVGCGVWGVRVVQCVLCEPLRLTHSLLDVDS